MLPYETELSTLLDEDKSGLKLNAGYISAFCETPEEIFAMARKLQYLGTELEELAPKVTETISTDKFTIKVTKIPVYEFELSHELSELEKEKQRIETQVKSVAELIKNIKEQQKIEGKAKISSHTYRRELV